MARFNEGNLIFEVCLDCTAKKYKTAEELYIAVLAASEAAFLDALADPIIQDEAERFLNGGVNAGKSDDQEGDAEVHRFVPGMN